MSHPTCPYCSLPHPPADACVYPGYLGVLDYHASPSLFAPAGPSVPDVAGVDLQVYEANLAGPRVTPIDGPLITPMGRLGLGWSFIEP